MWEKEKDYSDPNSRVFVQESGVHPWIVHLKSYFEGNPDIVLLCETEYSRGLEATLGSKKRDV